MSLQNDNTRQLLYLAALLHDIGKFYQRADDGNAGKEFNYLSQEVWKMQDVYCPPAYKVPTQHTHKHVLWTAQFIRENQLEEKFNLKGLERLASIHHYPSEDQILEKILQKADHLASGIDRTELKEDKDTQHEENSSFKTTQMRSIFESLLREQETSSHTDVDELFSYKYYLPVREISFKKDGFPQLQANDYDYKRLWEEFKKEFEELLSLTSDARTFSETFFNLLHKYTVAIPSSTMHLPDVSLFDHSKIVAAFATCLYDYLQEKNKLTRYDILPNEDAVLLIGGDISGIQTYIYNIISKYAAKNLKGRSFYLQLLVDTVIQKILKESNLFSANVVYASGGGFYLLAPNTNATKKVLENIENEIHEIKEGDIYTTLKLSLYLSIDYVTISENDILGDITNNKLHVQRKNHISKKWKDLTDKLNFKKRNRYSSQLLLNYNYFFEEAERGAQLQKDSITNEEILEHEKPVSIEDGILVKEITKQQIDIGKNLHHTRHLVLSYQEIDYWKKGIDFLYHENPYDLNIHWYFIGEGSDNSILRADDIRVTTLNDFHFIRSSFRGKVISYGFSFYGGNDYPTDENDEPRFFDQLAGETVDEFKRLGILRMDVDNLGQAFIHGFRDDRRTFSRYTSLSRSLDFFFKGYINEIWKYQPEFKKWINIVYAGGDDLFIVGKWNIVIQFAEMIYKEFREWTCHNPKLTLSAGIAIVPPKFPILKAAEIAADAEHKAKQHLCNGHEKNAICFLDMPLNWEIEFPIVKEYKDKLFKYINQELLPTSFLYKIYTLQRMRNEQKRMNKNESWRWIMTYDFSRFKERVKDTDLKLFFDNLLADILCNTIKGKKQPTEYHFLDLLNLSARWAELELRTKN
ncbi:MAG: type III-A CRISPR-associated protein Cas10/Csm1 [Thermoflavifilum sp.]|nr:type III-A CRISPR-associated protein Cas10/Csm1 [Thermoflavifilum sp.]